MDSGINDIIVPCLDHICSAHAWFSEHVKNTASGTHDVKNSFKAMMDHSFFTGYKRFDSHVGIGFVWHAEQKIVAVLETTLAWVFNGGPGSETFINSGVKVLHAGSTFGINTLAAHSTSSPNSNWVFATNTRLGECSRCWTMVLAGLAQH